MILAIIILLAVIAAIFLLKTMPAKISSIIIIIFVFGITAGICILKPVMHKPFSINVIEYLIKINNDGSITTTKQTTTTILEDKTQK